MKLVILAGIGSKLNSFWEGNRKDGYSDQFWQNSFARIATIPAAARMGVLAVAAHRSPSMW